MRTNYLFSLLFLFALCSLSAQQRAHCGSDEVQLELSSSLPQTPEPASQVHDVVVDNRMLQQKTGAVLHYIPVVFHVLWTDEEDNISREQILDGLRVLNEDYRRLNADASQTRAMFQAVAADAEIEFRLANKDPNGNCHSGIIRKQSPLSANPGNSSNSVKVNSNGQGSPSWDNNKYLNIWVVREVETQNSPSGTVLGYAYRPAGFANCSTCVSSQPPTYDGVILRHDQVGTIGTASAGSLPNATGGRTLTHEVGHYLNLHHPFSRSTNPSCSNANGDNIGDTPLALSANYGCNTSTNSCSNETPDLPDMIENHMDYADCPNTFTQGQKTEMKRVLGLSTWRGDVSSGANLNATGISLNNYDCVPSAFFVADRKTVCAGSSVQFQSRVEGGNVSSYSWSFPGGSPASSTVANPSVVYNQPGSYSVSLTLSNPNGNSDLIVQHYIKVQSAQTADANSLSEDFENLALLGADWSAFGAGDYLDFEIDKTVGYQSSSCLKLDNFSATKGQIDELYSPSLDVRFTTALNLRFRYAFATKESTDNDALRLYVSKDCGQTWVLTRIINTSSLITAGLKTASFTPASDADWKEYSVNLSSYAGGNEPVQIKWEMNSGGGNNLYIDQISMDASMSTSQQLFGSSLKLYPNPTSGTLYFESSEPIGRTPTVHLTDMSGRTMVLEAIQSERKWAIRLPLDLSNGLYQLQIVSEEMHHSASFQLQR